MSRQLVCLCGAGAPPANAGIFRAGILRLHLSRAKREKNSAQDYRARLVSGCSFVDNEFRFWIEVMRGSPPGGDNSLTTKFLLVEWVG